MANTSAWMDDIHFQKYTTIVQASKTKRAIPAKSGWAHTGAQLMMLSGGPISMSHQTKTESIEQELPVFIGIDVFSFSTSFLWRLVQSNL